MMKGKMPLSDQSTELHVMEKEKSLTYNFTSKKKNLQ